jgi:glycosyltransferase involved in cell wall biosynthesis
MKYPYMSVVIITHNGQDTLAKAIESLEAQTYPKNRYEIIVVDDASTDNSPAIAKKHSRVKYLGLKRNRGIPGARNAGLTLAKGDVYVAFDDDCAAEASWLKELAKGYVDNTPAGVGGRLVDTQANDDISDRYITSRDADMTLQPSIGSDLTNKSSIWQRIIKYFSQRPGHATDESTASLIEVEELYGANSSFSIDVLKKVGGWRNGMNSIEDRDICRRILKAYPERKFIVVPTATITHERGQNLQQYLHRQYKQGPYNLYFYKEHHQLPPVFPLPIIYLLLLVLASLMSVYYFSASLFLLPQLLYFWWPQQAYKQRRPLLLSFVYIQLAEEILVIIGLLRGIYWMIRKKAIYA